MEHQGMAPERSSPATGDMDKLVKHALRQTLLSADALDAYRENPESLGLHINGMSEAILCSRTIENCFRVRWLRTVVLVMSFLHTVWWVALAVKAKDKGKIAPYQYYRFTNLAQRADHASAPTTPGIEAFGMMRLGEAMGFHGNEAVSKQWDRRLCKASEGEGVLKVEGRTMVLSLGKKPSGMFDGFYVKTLAGEGTEGLDSVRFKVEGSHDPSFSSPSVVASSSFVRYFTEVVQTGLHDYGVPGHADAHVRDARELGVHMHYWGETPIPLERGRDVPIDMAMGPIHFFHAHIIILPLWIGAGMIGVLAQFRHATYCLPVAKGTFCIQVIFRISAAIMFYNSESSKGTPHAHSVYEVLGALSYAVGVCILVWAEEVFELSMVVISVFQLASQSLLHHTLFGTPLTLTVPGPFLEGVAWLLVVFVIVGSRSSKILRSAWAIRPAKAKYEEVWRRVYSEQADDVATLRGLVKAIKTATLHNESRQFNARTPELQGRHSSLVKGGLPLRTRRLSFMGGERSHESGDTLTGSNTGSMSRVQPVGGGSLLQVIPFVGNAAESSRQLMGDWPYLAANVLQSKRLFYAMDALLAKGPCTAFGPPVQSLDQLHSSAFLIHDIFIDFVVRLAGTHGGKFRASGEGARGGAVEFVTWDGSEQTRGTVALAGVKSVSSCVRKLNFSYQGDVSRLLDVCRETLYFDTVKDMEACLAGIADDDSLEIVRVKSTLDYSSEPTGWFGLGSEICGGMRFVSVSVRLAGSKAAHNMFVDVHVCELLLVLVDIGRVQTEEMRQEYRTWRMCKRAMMPVSRLVKWMMKMLGASKRQVVAQVVPTSSQPITVKAAVAQTRSKSLQASNASFTSGPSPDDGLADDGVTGRDLAAGCQFAVVGAEQTPKMAWVSNEEPGTRRPVLASTEPATGEDAPMVLKDFSQCSQNAEISPVGVPGDSLDDGSHEPDPGGATSTGLQLPGEMVELLRWYVRMSGLGFHDFLDSRFRSILVTCFEASNNISIFFTTHAFSASVQNWRIQVLLLFFASFGAWFSWAGVQLLSRATQPLAFGPYKHYRLETVLTRHGSEGMEVMSPGVSDFGILGISRCSTQGSLSGSDSRNATAYPVFWGPFGNSFLVSYAQGTSMTGWHLTSSVLEGSHGQDPAYFSVWASNSDPVMDDPSCAFASERSEWRNVGDETVWCGVTWDKVGAPFWTFYVGLSSERISKNPWDFLRVPIELPLRRGLLQTWVLIPTWNQIFWTWVVPNPLITVFVAATAISGALRKSLHWIPKAAVLGGLCTLVTFLCHMVTFIISVGDGRAGIAGLESFVRGTPMLVLSLIFFFEGPQTVKFLSSCCALAFTMWFAMCSYFWHHPFARSPAGLFVVLLVLVVIVVGFQRWNISRAVKLLVPDQIRYDALWKTLSENEDGKAGIEHLEKVVRMIGLDENNYCRQHNRMRADKFPDPLRAKYQGQFQSSSNCQLMHPVFLDLGRWYMPGRADAKSVVTSINQLYYQAAVANLLVVERLKEWAARTSGMFKLKSKFPGEQRRYAKWDKDDPNLAQEVEYAMMKKHGRVIEKLVRSYFLEPSRLLDISRNCLIFESMSDLTQCLGNIVTDENVRVERLKNRLSPQYQAHETGGYRDVCMNLRVVNPISMALGAELHMCEVQLMLLDFAKLKTDEGHRRYRQARHSRGT